MKLIVGDIHATNSSIKEVKSLFTLIGKTCQENKVTDVILLGDQTDSFGIQSLPVLHMYKEMFEEYDNLNFLCLVGNHDYAVNGNRNEHSMFPFKSFKNVTVVDNFKMSKELDIISFCRTEEEFLALCELKKSDTLICHQEFQGCSYENGFYSKNGFDLSKVPYKTVISGHIHKSQEWDKIWYPGAPRWLTKSDANENKTICLWDGKNRTYISTASVCRQIISLDIDENTEMPLLFDARYILNVTGNKKFLQKVYDKYIGKAEIHTNLITGKKVAVEESLGINKALENFVLNQYTSQFDVDKNVLLKEIYARLL